MTIKKNPTLFLMMALIFSFSAVFAPQFIVQKAFAQATADPDDSGVTADPQTNTNSTSESTPDVSFQLDNPLGDNVNTISDFIKRLLDVVLTIGIPVVALAIIYSGFLFVAAQGNTEKLSAAKKTFTYTLIGAAILLGAWVLAQVLSATIADIGSSI